jgi:hypothetical protein
MAKHKGVKRYNPKKKKTFLPNDFRDFLSILSFVGYLGIVLAFVAGITWINDNMTGLFLLLGGASFLIIGKVVNIKKWARDGIQQNELSLLIAIVFGLSSIVIGTMMLFEVVFEKSLYIGILAVVPALTILIDYGVKNKK